ncbi:MAG: 1,4-dihydroxy-2-naphthoyl-CoA hydrolase, partial [Synechococcales cyanobacterium H12SWP_bin.12]|nr:1,4-dihydroxy-2-naphthoyl-CoA hydrolase [Synechococcales cyanobacterium H12SWP_bin.12]
LNPGSFEVKYRFQLEDADVARGLIRHLAIETASRKRCALPEPIDLWLEASTVGKLEPI